MKRFPTAVMLITAIMIISAVNSAAAAECTDRLITATDDLSEKITTADTAAAVQYAENYSRIWRENEYRLAFILHNDRFADINASAAKIVPMTISGSDELTAELASIRRRLEKIRVEEIPSWYNIL